MKALFVALQDPSSRRWAPVGRLTHDKDGFYRFVYTLGAREATNFVPFGRMKDLKTEYVSKNLFPLFSNRTLPKSRPEHSDYMEWLGLSESDHDYLEELTRTGGVRATDNLALIPCPERTANEKYDVYFFAGGLQHLPSNNQKRTMTLRQGERLHIMRDLQNQHDPLTLLLRTGDPASLVGYCPRYYSQDFLALMDLVNPANVNVSVERLNPDAPTQYRVLCHLSAPWPKSFSPHESWFYKPIAEKKEVEV